MTNHLNEWEASAAAAGLDLEEARQEHLRHCLVCRSSIAAFGETIDLRRQDLAQTRPDWEGQRAAILRRMAEGGSSVRRVSPSRLRPLLAAAATVVLAVAGGAFITRSGPAPTPTAQPAIAIEEILSQAESLLSDDGLVDLDLFDTISDDDLNTLFPEQAS